MLVAIASTTDPHPVRVGFRVSKAVGNSVVRHRVYRQLRHLVRARLDAFKPGELVVVRAFPRAAGSTSAELEADLETAIRSARKKAMRRSDRYADNPNRNVSGAAGRGGVEQKPAGDGAKGYAANGYADENGVGQSERHRSNGKA